MRIVKNRICHMPSILLLLQKNIWVEQNSLPVFVNNTKMIKVYGLQDRQLSDLQYSKFIDDLDFETIDMSKCTNYILGLKEEAGAWVETADGKYRAYVYINKASARVR